MARKAGNILRELIIGFGFLNGVWLAIGINPQNFIIDFLKTSLENIHPILKIIFIILPILITIGTVLTIIKVYSKGGMLGAIAVLVAFAAGLLIIKNTASSIIILLVAMLLGLITFRKK